MEEKTEASILDRLDDIINADNQGNGGPKTAKTPDQIRVERHERVERARHALRTPSTNNEGVRNVGAIDKESEVFRKARG